MISGTFTKSKMLRCFIVFDVEKLYGLIGLSPFLPTTFSFIDWFTRKHAAYLAFPICWGRAQ